MKKKTFYTAFTRKLCSTKSLRVRNGFSFKHFMGFCSPVKPLRHIQPAVNTMNSTWTKTNAHRKLIAREQFCSGAESWCSTCVFLLFFFFCFETLRCIKNYDRVNNCLFFFFVTLCRPSPASSNAPANVPPHWYGGCGYLPSSCSASAAPCGLDKRWRTTGPVHGNENNTFPDGFQKTA